MLTLERAKDKEPRKQRRCHVSVQRPMYPFSACIRSASQLLQRRNVKAKVSKKKSEFRRIHGARRELRTRGTVLAKGSHQKSVAVRACIRSEPCIRLNSPQKKKTLKTRVGRIRSKWGIRRKVPVQFLPFPSKFPSTRLFAAPFPFECNASSSSVCSAFLSF
jgi:hypothetical protein